MLMRLYIIYNNKELENFSNMTKNYKYLDKCSEKDKNIIYTNLFNNDIDNIEYVLEAYNNNQITLKDNELVINDKNYKKIGYDLDKDILLWYKGKECIYDLIMIYQCLYSALEEIAYKKTLIEQYNNDIELN